MSTSEPEQKSCWECGRGKVLHLPGGGEYVDCPPANWKRHSCAVRLLNTIQKPLCFGHNAGRRIVRRVGPADP